MAALAVSAAVAAIGGTISAIKAGKEAKSAKGRAERAARSMKNIERGRAAIINPYENVTNLSGMAKDVSGMASNPYSNLSVATGAAEMQAEETDIALANTLDTLRSTGSSAGGATALAQAALASKKGISANIQEQEATNEKLKAQGELQLDAIKMSEAQRMQSIQMGEAARLQNADVMGKTYQFESKENRDARDLSRYASQEQAAASEQMAYKGAQMSAITGTVSSLGNMAIAGYENNWG
tara:strand:+ start:261 stop:980 length:720 start_codon:yes stop_codon:yes gene_type:complete